ncbi:hypothetical protein DL96DRAFT_1627537 [Flagelloscypha sp. PMI_526]|nr:hypothetical protein DL96DRAFT_1627537 [Flagelloscypha sp. PMI_526]
MPSPSSWSTSSSPLGSPTMGVTLPGIRDLFPDHIQKQQMASAPRPPRATIYIPDHYSDSGSSSSSSSETCSPQSEHSSVSSRSWSPSRHRGHSVSSTNSSPPPVAPQRQYNPYPRPRSQTVVEDYTTKYGGQAIRTAMSRSATHLCDLCGKRFDRPSSLRTHYNSHTGVTPFKCPWPHCGREFNVKSNMRRHYRKHQGIEQVQQPSLQAHDPHAPSNQLLLQQPGALYLH